MKRIFIPLGIISLILFLQVSCSNRTSVDQSANYVKINIDSLMNEEATKFSQIFSKCQFIILENSPEALIDKASKIIFSDSSIYIFDMNRTKSIYKFDINGKLLFKIKNIGKGPYEYLEPSDIMINDDNKTLEILDWYRPKILIHNQLDGSEVGSIDLNKRYHKIICDEDRYICYNPRPFEISKNSHILEIIDHKGKVIKEYFNYKKYGRNQTIRISHIGGNFHRSDSDIKFYRILNDTIYSIFGNKVSPSIVLKTNKYKLTDEDLFESQLNGQSFFKEKKLMGIYGYSENSRYALIQYKIGTKNYNMIYSKKQKKVICNNLIEDDVAHAYPNLLQMNDSGIYGMIHPMTIGSFKKRLLNDEVEISKEQKEQIFRQNLNLNLILVYYEFN